MRIAMLGHKRVPSRSGGIEVVVAHLSERLVKFGNRVDIYNRWAGEKREREYCGAKIYEIPTMKNPKINAQLYSFLATLCACVKRYDVLHYHAEGQFVMIPIARLFGKRVVATVHGLDWQRSKWGGFATKYIKFGEKMAVRFAHEIIVLSPKTQEYFLREYGRETKVIPNGVEIRQRRSPQLIKERFALTQNSYILFLARITPEKGLHYLIDAFKTIDTDKKLVIAGDMGAQNEYTDLIKKKIKDDNRIITTGFVSGELLDELFTNCFLYVLPSDIEGMPLSLLEAIGFRARCLVSDIPENADISPEYLHTFKVGSTADLTEKLTAIFEKENQRAANFGKSADAEETEKLINNVTERFNWDAVARQTLQLYTKQ